MLWLLAAAALAAAPIPRLPATAVRPAAVLVTQAAAARLAPAAPAPAGRLQAVAALAAALPESPSPAATLEDFWSGMRRPAVEAQSSLDAIISAANASPTARSVLARVARRGPVPVAFKKLDGNIGEYDYVTGVLYLQERASPATLIHELVHVLQHAEGLPAEALELELEAHAITLQVMRELGLPPDNPFSWRAAKKLGQGPEAFTDWLEQQLPSKHRLRDVAGVIDSLELEAERLEEKLDDARHPAQRARLEALLAWTRRDLASLRTRAGRRRYERFARRVRARLGRLHPLFATPLPG